MLRPKIQSLIERLFIGAGLVILITTLLVGFYFNRYDDLEKQKNNIQKIHAMLSHLISPSLIISDISEVSRLLYMVSGEGETYLVVDNDGTIIMPDYSKNIFSKFVSTSYKVSDCNTFSCICKANTANVLRLKK